MRYIVFFTLLLAYPAFAEQFSERELKTTIEEVTIYVQGGLITRTGKLEIPPGKSILRLTSLSPYIDEKSVQVKAAGDFTILSVNHRLNYLSRLKRDAKVDSLKKQLESLDAQIATAESRLQVLAEKQSLLDKNKHLGGTTSGASLTEIKQAIEFYDRELTSIKSEELASRRQIKELMAAKGLIVQEIAGVQGTAELPTGEIEIMVEADFRTEGAFTVTYVVANTGWYPKYDLRVTRIDQPLELYYKADIYQNTGVDWGNVKLKLSNANPNQSGVVPQLETWHLNYTSNTFFGGTGYGALTHAVRNVSGKILDENGEPLPGATVLVSGTTVGTVTDSEGYYALTLPNGATYLSVSFVGYESRELPITGEQINVRLTPDEMALQEVVVVGYGVNERISKRNSDTSDFIRKKETVRLSASTIENQTTVEFEVDKPCSIKSNGEKQTVDLKRYEIETVYEYYAVPKLDKDAFLMARIINWDQYNLLEGEANLYFEDAYVGRSVLDARSLEDTLNISLGRDKSIVIGREKVEEFSRRRTIGSNKIDNQEFKITVRNKKSQRIRLTLFDQIPVAAINEITVAATELSGGKLSEKTGEVKWEVVLDPLQQKEWDLSYEVRYPKNEKVLME